MNQDSYYVDSPVFHDFIREVQRTVAAEPNRRRTVQLLRDPFRALLTDGTWLPREFRVPDTGGGMGGGIGNYLLYRSSGRDLTLMSLVIPPATETPIHDHLAWGLVGLYSGDQHEWVYRHRDPHGDAGLVETENRRLRAGDFYELLPPEGDIHRVRTVSEVASVSLHLLGNDIGCTWRHRYELHPHAIYPFRSSYSNQPCREDARATPADPS